MRTPDASADNPVEPIVGLLEQHRVEYMLIGGQAEVLMGGGRPTYDIAYARDPDNLARLASALQGIHPKLRIPGGDVPLPFPIDARFIEGNPALTLTTDIIDVDLLGIVEPIGDYSTLLERHETFHAFGYEIKTIELDDLIRVKEHIKRPKDVASLDVLRRLKASREGTR